MHSVNSKENNHYFDYVGLYTYKKIPLNQAICVGKHKALISECLSKYRQSLNILYNEYILNEREYDV